MPILKVKNKETGQWEQVGVSTEATGAQIAAHNVATNAHQDIRQAVANAGTALSTHNTATNAHADIRQAIVDRVKTFRATISTSWTATAAAGVKAQQLAIPGVLASHTATIAHDYTGSYSTASFQEYATADNQYVDCIKNGFAKTYNGGITFYIFGATNTVPIPIVVEVS